MAEPAVRLHHSWEQSGRVRPASGVKAGRDCPGDSASAVSSSAHTGTQPATKPDGMLTRAQIAENLLAIEAEIRGLNSLSELRYFAVNEFHKLTGASQILFHAPRRSSAVGPIITVRGLAIPDPNAPLLCWLEKSIGGAISRQINQSVRSQEGALPKTDSWQFRLDTASSPSQTFTTPAVLTVPLHDTAVKHTLGAVSFLSRRALEPAQVAIAERLCLTLAHAMARFSRPRGEWWQLKFARLVAIGAAALALLLLLPVTMTVTAPATIRPVGPEVVAAPISGVIEKIFVDPNQQVVEGDLLFKFNHTQWQNEHDLADKAVAVAQARFKRASQDAFTAGEGRRELAIAEAELALAVTEKTAALRRLALTEVRAGSSGIVLFDSHEKWAGKPVSTGERVMRISATDRLELVIDLAVNDNILLPENARVRMFPDANPLSPVEARLVQVSYETEMSERGTPVFKLVAEPLHGRTDDLKLGMRGTAQVYGEPVALWYFLFRKPLAFVRQFAGI